MIGRGSHPVSERRRCCGHRSCFVRHDAENMRRALEDSRSGPTGGSLRASGLERGRPRSRFQRAGRRVDDARGYGSGGTSRGGDQQRGGLLKTGLGHSRFGSQWKWLPKPAIQHPKREPTSPRPAVVISYPSQARLVNCSSRSPRSAQIDPQLPHETPIILVR